MHPGFVGFANVRNWDESIELFSEIMCLLIFVFCLPDCYEHVCFIIFHVAVTIFIAGFVCEIRTVEIESLVLNRVSIMVYGLCTKFECCYFGEKFWRFLLDAFSYFAHQVEYR